MKRIFSNIPRLPLYKKHREMILYLIFGAATTLVNWVAYTLLLVAFEVAVSNAAAWAVSVVFAFVVNKVFVFNMGGTSGRETAKEFAFFVGARALSGVVDIGGLPLLILLGLDQTIFGIEAALAKLIVSVVVVVLNYIFSKFIVFRKKRRLNTASRVRENEAPQPPTPPEEQQKQR